MPFAAKTCRKCDVLAYPRLLTILTTNGMSMLAMLPTSSLTLFGFHFAPLSKSEEGEDDAYEEGDDDEEEEEEEKKKKKEKERKIFLMKVMGKNG